MKLAIIDHLDRPHFWTSARISALEKYLADREIDVYRAENLEGFEEEYGSLDSFDCLLYHPGIVEQANLGEIHAKHSRLRLAIGSHEAGSSYYADGDIPVFEFTDLNGIYDFFSKTQ